MYTITQLWFSIPLFIFWLIFVLKKSTTKKITLILVSLVVLIVLTDQSSNQVKHAVKRYRPSHNLEIQELVHSVNNYKGGQYGFFSSHAANTFGVATFLCLLFNDRKLIFKYHFFIWAIVVSFTRIYLGVHYPSDIFVGMLDGILVGFVVFKIANIISINKFNEKLI